MIAVTEVEISIMKIGALISFGILILAFLLIGFFKGDTDLLSAISTTIAAAGTLVALIWIYIGQKTQLRILQNQQAQLDTNLSELKLNRNVMTKSAAAAEIEGFSKLRDELTKGLQEISKSIYQLIEKHVANKADFNERFQKEKSSGAVYQSILAENIDLEKTCTKLSKAEKDILHDLSTSYLQAYELFWDYSENLISGRVLMLATKNHNTNYKLYSALTEIKKITS